MAFPSVTFTITNNTPNDATQVAQNFTDCINAMKDGTKDFSISALTVGGILALSSTISSSLTPTTNTSYDQGTSTKGWASLYLGGTSTFTLKLVSQALSASGTLNLPIPVSTSPAISRLQFADALQPVNSTTAIIKQFGSSTRTLSLADSSTGTAAPVVTSASPNNHGLMIVRGTVHWNNSAMVTDAGEGFTPTHSSTGIYLITFTTAFATLPSVTASLNGLSANGIQLVPASVTTASFQIQLTTSAGVATENGNNMVSFTAIGERSA